MSLVKKAVTVLLQQIDFEDDTFSLVPFTETSSLPDALIQSIRRVGVLHPPILRQLPTRLQIITGRKRLHILRDEEKRTSSVCLVMDSSTQDADCFGILVEDLLAGRPLTPVERAIFLEKSLSILPREQAVRRFFPLLGLGPNPGAEDRCLALLALEEPLLKAVHQGDLDERTAVDLCHVTLRDRLALFEVIMTLRLSVSNQRKLLGLVTELAKRANMTIMQFLSQDEVTEILAHHAANPPQKAALFLNWLGALKNPRLKEAEKEFATFAAKLKMPDGMSLAHSPSFERDSVSVTISFPDQKDLAARLPAIKQALTDAI